VDAESARLQVTEPATGETFAEVAEADKADIDKAVAAARKAFEGNGQDQRRDRGRILQTVAVDRSTRW